MSKKIVIIFLAVILILLALGQFFSLNDFKQIEIGKEKFKAETVSASGKLEKGLGERKELCQNCAMFFDFPERGEHIFWMKDMNFDLDIIWIDQGKIVHIEKDVSHKTPQKTYSGAIAEKVLEINAGLSDKYDFKIGDRIIIR